MFQYQAENSVKYNIFDLIYSAFAVITVYTILLIFIILSFIFILIAPTALIIIRYLSVYFSSLMLSLIGIKQKVINHHYIAQHPKAIIASNHASYCDSIMHTNHAPNAIYVLGKFLKKIPLCYHDICVDFNNNDTSALRETIAKLKNNMQVVIYPTGTRTSPARKKPFLPGIAYIAYHSKAPIIPATLNTEWVGNMSKYTKHFSSIMCLMCLFKLNDRSLYLKYHKPVHYTPFMTRIHYNEAMPLNPMSIDFMYTIFDHISVDDDLTNEHIVNLYNQLKNHQYFTNNHNEWSLQANIAKYQQQLQNYHDILYHNHDNNQNDNQNADNAQSDTPIQLHLNIEQLPQLHNQLTQLHIIKFSIFIEILKESITLAKKPLKMKYAQAFAHELQILIESDPVFTNTYHPNQ